MRLILRNFNSFTVLLIPHNGSYCACPGDNFGVTCTVQNSNKMIIGWELSISGHEPFEPVYFTALTLPGKNDTIGPFSQTFLSVDLLTSTANLSSVGNDQNGAVLTCTNLHHHCQMKHLTLSFTLNVSYKLLYIAV